MSNLGICGECGRDINDCPWLHESKPVEKWLACPTVILCGGHYAHSYKIEYCPLYAAPKPRRKNKEVLTPEQDKRFFERQAKHGRKRQMWCKPSGNKREGGAQ